MKRTDWLSLFYGLSLCVVAATRPPGGCHDDEMQCRDGSGCITNRWRCDRHADCDDGSDEQDCGTVNFSVMWPGA